MSWRARTARSAPSGVSNAHTLSVDSGMGGLLARRADAFLHLGSMRQTSPPPLVVRHWTAVARRGFTGGATRIRRCERRTGRPRFRAPSEAHVDRAGTASTPRGPRQPKERRSMASLLIQGDAVPSDELTGAFP